MITSFRPRNWLYLFISLHLLLWTLIPVLVRFNLPLDSIEGTLWGHQLQWGYDKNPFLNGWLTALAIYLGGTSGWMIYFFSQLSVAACFWAVWKLAKHILSPAYALITVMLLEVIQYYNFHAIDFNDNTLELGLWALCIYYFYLACRDKSPFNWAFTGIFAGLSMMAKYYTAALLAPMALFLFCEPNTRKQLKTSAPYLGLGMFSIIVLPHFIWLCFHDFITVTYVFDRAKNTPSWMNHFIFPVRFAWQQFQAFLPATLLSLFLLLGKPARNKELTLSAFNQQFLLVVGLGPFILTLLLSLLTGITLRAGWGMPLLSLWPIILLAYLKPELSIKKLYLFITTIFICMFSLLSTYSITLVASNDASSANYPGKEIANTIAQQWNVNYHTKLSYVAGSRWVGGNIEFYAKDHPAVFVEWNKQRAPWINLKDMQKKGAVFVWEITGNESLPTEVARQYPRLQKPHILQFAYHRNEKLEPVKIGVAVLPPA